MSYLCGICGEAVPHGEALRKHVVYEGKQIRAEIPVCERCDSALWAGQTMQEIRTILSTPGRELVAAGVSTNTLPRPLPQPAPNASKPRGPRQEQSLPRCDVCGDVVIDGQVTAESSLCAKHLRKRRR